MIPETNPNLNPYIFVGLVSKHSPNRKKVTITKEITDIVCSHYQCNFEDIDTPSRKRELVEIRQAVMYWHTKASRVSLSNIGTIFTKCFDHSTVSHARDNYQDLIDTNKHIKALNKLIEAEINRKIL